MKDSVIHSRTVMSSSDLISAAAIVVELEDVDEVAEFAGCPVEVVP
jgi:hypothetical protein